MGAAAVLAGAWPLAMLVFGALILSLRQRRMPRQADRGLPLGRMSVALLLFAFALAGWLLGGTYSPFVFGGAGALALFWPALLQSKAGRSVTPMGDSILLRGKRVPALWRAVAEVKFEPGCRLRGASGLAGNVMVLPGRSPSFLVIAGCWALRYKTAESKVLKSLGAEAARLSPLGAHLMPLDSRSASQRLGVKLSKRNLDISEVIARSPLPDGLLSLVVFKGRVVSTGAYGVVSEDAGAVIPRSYARPRREPLMAELAERLVGEAKAGGDDVTALLSALDAGRGAGLAERLVVKGSPGTDVSVEVPGGLQVTVTRPQLRALASIYG